MTPSKVKREEPAEQAHESLFLPLNSFRLSGNEIENVSIEETFLAIVLVVVIDCLIGFFVD